MDEEKPVSSVQHHRMQDIPGMRNGRIKITLRERQEAGRLQSGIKKRQTE